MFIKPLKCFCKLRTYRKEQTCNDIFVNLGSNFLKTTNLRNNLSFVKKETSQSQQYPRLFKRLELVRKCETMEKRLHFITNEEGVPMLWDKNHKIFLFSVSVLLFPCYYYHITNHLSKKAKQADEIFL